MADPFLRNCTIPCYQPHFASIVNLWLCTSEHFWCWKQMKIKSYLNVSSLWLQIQFLLHRTTIESRSFSHNKWLNFYTTMLWLIVLFLILSSSLAINQYLIPAKIYYMYKKKNRVLLLNGSLWPDQTWHQMTFTQSLSRHNNRNCF